MTPAHCNTPSQLPSSFRRHLFFFFPDKPSTKERQPHQFNPNTRKMFRPGMQFRLQVKSSVVPPFDF
jgi:hypothetical protein